MSRKPRTLALCFDGTTNEFGSTNTNVVKLYSLLRKDKVEDQLCYYQVSSPYDSHTIALTFSQAGIGTYIQPGVVSPLFEKAAEILDDTIAWYLYQHIMDGYKFLMQSYNVGDKVCLFGFSRGAYTARALAGMLHKVGLLSRDNVEQIPFAYELYKSDGNDALAQEFKMAFSREVPIEFVGVWDTVASVGFITSKTLPFADVNTTIRVFRQALSLDEHRAKFLPNLYHHSVPKQPETGGLGGDDKPTPTQETVPGRKDELYDMDLKEVWFAGCHTDVGGGSTPDSVGHSLANIPLRWMIREVMRAECGIQFDLNAFARWNIPNDRADALDIVQPIHDDLGAAPVWWLLEIVPTQFTYQNAQDRWISSWGLHLGRGRYVPPKPLFHESVKTRMQDPKLKYKPRAVYTQGTESYVT
ncbi:hypothetical protein EDB92DRAFT_1795941 [Lactarius akahatsu]|uniref:T6SS Phospholipase effector Tle1-like catalytic domain-containing protein n=1 Tax=Lactarius akahatsu TaxID=416441 RepID=A0AAD4Q989_9AGAM|nr:hypothetical protein EDB92DRAFT_1795941 [Lactarius akahatsu]